MKKYIFAFVIIIILIMGISYFTFTSGITKKVVASLRASAVQKKENPGVYNMPVITNVINSSGENFVNTDIAIIINATSNYNIKYIKYSYDMKKWKTIDGFDSKEITHKLVFKKSINKKLYIKVENEKGYASYPYKTVVKIDKKKPKLSYNNNDLKLTDNYGLKYIQYSNDKLKWETEDIAGKKLIIDKKIEYKYVRAVDIAGNISKINKILTDN